MSAGGIDLRHSIYKRKGRKGWTLEYRVDGLSTQRSCPRRVDAEAAWDDIKEERRRRVGLRTATPTFSTYAARWLDALRPRLRPSSVLKYEWALQHLDPLAPLLLDAIDRETVRTLLAEKASTLSPSSAAAIGGVLFSCLAEAVADGYLRANPAAGGGSLRGRRTRERGAPKALDAQQLRIFLCVAPQPWRDFFHVAWALGLRPGEAMGLQPADVDLERARVLVQRTIRAEGGVGPTKGGSGWVDLAPAAAAILRRRIELTHPSSSDTIVWLFPNPRGGPLDHVTVERAFKRIAQLAGLPPHLTPHSLRHTFAALLLQAGRSIYYVQRMLRHASIQVTVDTYGSWLDPGRPEHVAAMEMSVISAVGGPDAAVAGGAA